MSVDLLVDLQNEVSLTRQSFADDTSGFESSVVKLLYLIALILIYIAKKGSE